MRTLTDRRNCISHAGELIEYKIIHRPAVTRRIHLEIDTHGGLQVVAPRRMSPGAVRQALQQRSLRVARFLSEARRQQGGRPDLLYVNGEEHLFLGRHYPLRVLVQPGSRGKVEMQAKGILVIAADEQAGRISQQLQKWYRQQAKTYFTQRLSIISELAPWTVGQQPALRLRRMKRTWGNCSAKGLITLNTHLIKAPAQVIDYVISHEVCHLREHNHSRAFYALQQELFPSWRETKAELKQSGHIYLNM